MTHHAHLLKVDAQTDTNLVGCIKIACLECVITFPVCAKAACLR